MRLKMNPLQLIKPYLWGGAILIVLGLFLSIFWLRDSLQDAKTEAATEKAAKTEALSKITKIEQEAAEESQNRTEYLSKLEQAENERNRLQNCITDKSCAVTVRVRVPTVCPANQENSAAGAITTTAELDPPDRQLVLDLRARAKKLEAKYAFCQETLKAWSD
jgi:hypothetical protein